MLLPGDILWERFRISQVGSAAPRCAWLKSLPPPPSGTRGAAPESGESTVATHLLLALDPPFHLALADMLNLLWPAAAPGAGTLLGGAEDLAQRQADIPLFGKVQWRGAAADGGVAVTEISRRAALNVFRGTLAPARVLRLLQTLSRDLQQVAGLAWQNGADPARFYACAAKLLNPEGIAAEASGERLLFSCSVEERVGDLRPPAWCVWAAPEVLTGKGADASALVFGLGQLARCLLFGVEAVTAHDQGELGEWGAVAENARGERDLARSFARNPGAAELPAEFAALLARCLKTRPAARFSSLERLRAALNKLERLEWAQESALQPMPLAVTKTVTHSIPPTMVLVPAGSYLSGEKKVPRTLRAFAIDALPVTEEEYRRFLAEIKREPRTGGPGSRPSKFDKHPVVNISWHEVEEYATHYGKRLPTVYEWEKAARGSDGRKFPYGEAYISLTGKLRVGGVSGSAYKESAKEAIPVGSFPLGASPYAVLDMAGNVLEWTSTARRQGERMFRAVKGACFLDGSIELSRCASLQYKKPDTRENFLGFRCVKDLE